MEDTGITTNSKAAQGYQFGAFKGVFTPSILTILGVVMYLRFGWVLGNLGLVKTLLMVTVCCTITFLTGLSLSALATNMRVRGGGAYFMISRSLGVEFGAALGFPLYAAQALGIAFYATGFAESVVDTFPTLTIPGYGTLALTIRMVAAITLVLVALLAYISADLALKSQFIVMTIIFLSLGSLFLGGPTAELIPKPSMDPVPYQGFFRVFAVFFPAVTGIEAGIAMSGDLKDPAKALPRGTLGAVITGYVVYMFIPLYMAFFIGLDEDARQVLIQNKMILRHVARWGMLIVAGVWAASLSSAMGAILGAPRTLQALANDRVVPAMIGKGYGRGNDPRLATAISFGVGLVAVLLGDLDAIANLLTMFFLTSYGLLNVCAGLEEFMSPPSWRPKFRVYWPFSLAGALLCFAAMLMIDPGSTILAILVIGGAYYAMKRRRLKASWGDMRSGVLMMIARFAVHALARRPPDEHTWKPNLLVFTGVPSRRWYMVELANAMSQGRGFLTFATVLPKNVTLQRTEEMTTSIRDYLAGRGVDALVKVFPADHPYQGLRMLTQTYGFGPIKPNTILLGETENPENYLDFSELVLNIHRQRQNLIIVRENGEKCELLQAGDQIDLWWGGLEGNEGLMLALAYTLTRSHGWREATLNLKTIVRDSMQQEVARKRLERFISIARLNASPHVLTVSEPDIFKVIRENSDTADIVFLGMRPPQEEDDAQSFSDYYKHLLTQTEAMPTLALVLAAEKIDFSALFLE